MIKHKLKLTMLTISMLALGGTRSATASQPCTINFDLKVTADTACIHKVGKLTQVEAHHLAEQLNQRGVIVNRDENTTWRVIRYGDRHGDNYFACCSKRTGDEKVRILISGSGTLVKRICASGPRFATRTFRDGFAYMEMCESMTILCDCPGLSAFIQSLPNDPSISSSHIASTGSLDSFISGGSDGSGASGILSTETPSSRT